VLDRVGEVAQRTDRNGLFWRVLGGRVGLGKPGNDWLHVALGAQGARLDKRLVVVDAATVHVDTGVDVVQGVADTVETCFQSVKVNPKKPYFIRLLIRDVNDIR